VGGPGLLLFTGGQGRRFGGAKHTQPHPDGGTWGGHLAGVFSAVFPHGPIQVLGLGLPDRPDLVPMADPGAGPAVALRHWAGRCGLRADRWWLLPCDQLAWTSASLADWHRVAEAADPGAAHWVMARTEGRAQPLGGFLAASLLDPLSRLPGQALMALADALPCRLLDAQAGPWRDVDTRADLARFLAGRADPRSPAPDRDPDSLARGAGPL